MTDELDRDVIDWTEAFLTGDVSRRGFLEGLLGAGLTMAAATQLVQSLAPVDVLAASVKPKRGGTLTIGYPDEIPALDPHTSPSESSIRFFYLVYSSLLMLDKHLKPVPDLAESMHISPNGLKYTFKLRKGLKFSNGWPLTSKDVKATFERILNPKTVAIASSFYANIKEIATPDAHTVVFHLSSPNAALPTYLTSMNSAILPARLINSGADFGKIQNSIGAGPFKVSKWVQDNYMLLSRNPHFYEPGKPYVDHIKVSIHPTTASLLAAMRGGAVDYTWTLDAITGREAGAGNALNVIRTPDLSYYLLFLQTADAPFKSKYTRQAISYAIDRKAIISGANLGEGEPVGTIPVGLKRYALPTSKLAGYKRDINKAKQLLAQGGQKNGFQFTLLTQRTDPDNAQAIAQIVQSQLKDIGLTANINLMDFTAWVQYWLKADYQMMPGNNGGGPDPDVYLYRYFYSQGNLNFVTGHWHSHDLDHQLTVGRSTNNLKVRKAAYDKAQKVLVDGSPFIWLYSGYLYSILSKKVHGFSPRANHSLVGIRDVWLS